MDEEFDGIEENTSESVSNEQIQNKLQVDTSKMQATEGKKEVSGEKYICDICGEEFTTWHALGGHMKRHKKEEEKEEKWEGVKHVREQQNEQIKPPEIEILDEAIKFIEERLKQVYGISDNLSKIIIKSLKDNPMPLRDANLLFNFIKSMAPRAYDMHIATFIVSPLYANFPNLPEAVDVYLNMNRVPQTIQQFNYMQIPTMYPPPMPYQQLYPYNPFYPRFYPFYPYYPIYQPEKETKQEKLYKIVVDGQEIETDESGFLAWQKYLREREEYERKKQEHELQMKKLELEIKKMIEESSKEEKIPVKIRDKEYMLPISYALPYILKISDTTNDKIAELEKKLEESMKKLEEEREARYRNEIEALKRELEEFKRRPSFVEELAAYEAIAERLGLSRSGKTTLDVLDSLIGKIDQRAAQLLEKIPAPIGREWKPEVKRLPGERRQVAEKILEKLGKTEEIIQVENELIEAATKLKSRMSKE